jgi:hypothetical protein
MVSRDLTYFLVSQADLSSVVIPSKTDKLSLNESLPLVQDPTGAWIPVQMLNVVGPQFLTRYGHLNNTIGTVTRDFLKLNGYARLFEISARIQRDFPAIASGFEAVGSTQTKSRIRV